MTIILFFKVMKTCKISRTSILKILIEIADYFMLKNHHDIFKTFNERGSLIQD